MGQHPEATAIVMAMVVDESLGVIWSDPVQAPIENPTMVTVTRAAPHPQGVRLHPTVGVAEAVVMTTMAAVPGMDMAVVMGIPAVGVTHTPLVVVTARVGRSGDHSLLSREAILLENTAAQAAGHLGVAEAAGQIEEWPGADTKMNLNGEIPNSR